MWNWLTRGSEARNNEEQGVSEVQELLRGFDSRRAEPSALFAKRVMAAINATEAELARRSRAWAACLPLHPPFGHRGDLARRSGDLALQRQLSPVCFIWGNF